MTFFTCEPPGVGDRVRWVPWCGQMMRDASTPRRREEGARPRPGAHPSGQRRSRGSPTCINLRSQRIVLHIAASRVVPWQTPPMPSPSTTSSRSFLSVADLPPAAIVETLDLADALKAGQATIGRPLDGATVALLFEKPSLRTRVSFEVAIGRLGGRVVTLTGAEIGVGSREPAADVARVLERYVDAIVARVFRHGMLEELAAAASIPVINRSEEHTSELQSH